MVHVDAAANEIVKRSGQRNVSFISDAARDQLQKEPIYWSSGIGVGRDF